MAYRIIHGVCPAALAELPDGSVDSAVCDPPYEIGFMGKGWDASGIAYSVPMWTEVFRVLKPGAHLLSFGGTRTYHRMACAVEDAGFEIRDSLEWFYGSGYPKSLNVGRAIDESFCREPGRHYWAEVSLPRGDQARPGDHVCARTPAGEAHNAEGTALKPAHEPIVLARKSLVGTVAANVLEHGVGGLNIDACRVGYGGRTLEEVHREAGGPGKHGTTRGVVYGEGLDRRDSLIEFHAAGRWPPNLLLTHAADCGETCAPGCPVAALDEQSGACPTGALSEYERSTAPPGYKLGMAQLGRRSALGWNKPGESGGGASRFFPVFRWDAGLDIPFLYCAKPARSERDAGCEDLSARTGGEATDRKDGSAGLSNPRAGAGRNGGAKNFHPTVKPIALMEWLCRLVTPPGGLVLDPFLGSGSTGCAALRQGFDFIGVEREAPYIEIARRRIELAAGVPRAKSLGELVRLRPAAEPVPQMGLFVGEGA